MKEQTLIQKFKEAEVQRIQNNQMIGEQSQAIKQLQDLVSGLIKVVRTMPCYEETIEKLKTAEAKANLDLGKDEEE